MLSVFLSLMHAYTTLMPLFVDTFVAPSEKNSVAITFDDGPHPVNTPAILDILKEKGVKATFFVIGLHIPRDEKAILREIREGHTVGGHSFSHGVFSKMSLPVMAREIYITHLKLFSLTGIYPHYFRFPYGIDDVRVRKFYSGKVIGWNVDAYDWKAKNPSILAKNIIAQTKAGSIILLHDIKEDTVKALPIIIDGIRAKGLKFVPLSSLIAATPTHSKNIVYYSMIKTGSLHDHTKSKKPAPKSSEQGLEPLIITEVGKW